MALTIDLRNVNPIGAVSAYLDDLTVEVGAGDTISVTPETAGRAPRWRRAEVDSNGSPTEDVTLMHTRQHAGHLEVFDLGEGLLAQPQNWRLASDDPDEPTADPLSPGHQVADSTDEEND